MAILTVHHWDAEQERGVHELARVARDTVGVFVQANFGRRQELTIAGAPVGRMLADDNPEEDDAWFAPGGAGSVIAVAATDAPLLPGQCKALARRVSLGLARTGTTGSPFSGDIFLAFSTANDDALASRLGDGGATGSEAPGYATLQFIPGGGRSTRSTRRSSKRPRRR